MDPSQIQANNNQSSFAKATEDKQINQPIPPIAPSTVPPTIPPIPPVTEQANDLPTIPAANLPFAGHINQTAYTPPATFHPPTPLDIPKYTPPPQPLTVASAPPPPESKFPKVILAVLGVIIIVGGFAFSFLFFQSSNKSSRKLGSVPPITPPVSIFPSATPVSNPFLSPTQAVVNPFISPTGSYENPFGSYQNPFTQATASANSENQAYQNPFEGLK